MKRILSGMFAAIGILVLILDPRAAADAIRSGIELCTSVVIPSLFPFFILSSLLTASLSGRSFSFLRPMEELCRMSPGSGALFLVGVLGGYPAGACNIVQIYRGKLISKDHSRRLLWFCSNTGPAFIFGMIAVQFAQRWVPWMIWSIHIISAIMVGCIAPGDFRRENTGIQQKQLTLQEALEQAGKNIVKVCLWVLTFRIIYCFLNRWFLWLLPLQERVLLSGIMELTMGVTSLSEIIDDGFRFIAATGMVSFGGICVAMQTAAVAVDMGMGGYFAGKALQTVFSVLLAVLVWQLSKLGWIGYLIFGCVCAAIFALFRTKTKNKGSIVVKAGV